jgi:hypothetical protein
MAIATVYIARTRDDNRAIQSSDELAHRVSKLFLLRKRVSITVR